MVHDKNQGENKTPSDPELVSQLREYLDNLSRRVDTPHETFFHLEGRRLSDLYIEPSVYVGSSPECGKSVAWKGQFERALRDDRPWRAIISGHPGEGKSVLLVMTTRALAAHSLHRLHKNGDDLPYVPIPVCLPLIDLLQAEFRSGTSAQERLCQTLLALPRRDEVLGSDAVAAYVASKAGSRQIWLFLDGLDGAVYRLPERLMELLQTLAKCDCSVLLSSRPYAREAIKVPFDTEEYRLAEFSSGQTGSFIQRWFSTPQLSDSILAQVEGNRQIKWMARNPLLLTLLCWVVSREDQDLVLKDMSRSELYERILRDILSLPGTGGIGGDEQRAVTWLRLLPKPMLEFLKLSQQNFPTEWLLNLMEEIQGQIAPLEIEAARDNLPPAGHLLEELVRKGLLFPVDRARSAYRPFHFSMVEYLAACALADELDSGSPDAWRRLDKMAWDPKWEEVILFAAGRVRDPQELIELLADPERDDYFRHRFALAVRCVGEFGGTTGGTYAGFREQLAADFLDHWLSCPDGGIVGPWLIRNYREALFAGLHFAGSAHVERFRRQLAQYLSDDAAGRHNRGMAVTMLLSIGFGAVTNEISTALTSPRKLRARSVRRLRDSLEQPSQPTAATRRKQDREKSAVLDIAQRFSALFEIARADRSKNARELLAILRHISYRKTARYAYSAHLDVIQELPAKILDRIQKSLTASDKAVRACGAWLLVATGPVKETAALDQALLGLLNSTEEDILIVAIYLVMVVRPGSRSREVQLCLLDLALHPRQVIADVATAAASTLKQDVLQQDFLPRLEQRLRSDDFSMVEASLRVVRGLGPRAGTPEIVKQIIELTGSSHSALPDAVVVEVARAVLRLGPALASQDVALWLVDASQHEHWRVRFAVGQALGKVVRVVKKPEVTNAIRGLLTDVDPRVREAATMVFHTDDLKTILSMTRELKQLLHHDREGTRHAAAQAVFAFPPEDVDEGLIKGLLHQLDHPASPTARIAANVLAGKMRQGLRVFRSGENAEAGWKLASVEQLSRLEPIRAAARGPQHTMQPPISRRSDDGEQAPRGTKERYYSISDLEKHHGIPKDKLRKPLERIRKKRREAWVELPDGGGNQPKYIYKESMVMDIIDAAKEKAEGAD